MANPKPIPKKAKHGEELVQRTRAAVLNTFGAIEKRGKVISEILADEFEKNPIKFMELASKLLPKEIHGDINHNHTGLDALTDDDLNERIAEYRTIIEAMRGGISASNTDGGNPVKH